MNASRYNLLVFCLIAVITLTVIFAGNVADTSSSNTETDVNISADDNNTSSDTSTSSEPNTTVNVAPSFTSGWACYNYAYKLTMLGQGYTSVAKQVVTVPVVEQQVVWIYKTFDGTNCLEETYSSGYKNFYEMDYICGDKVYVGKYTGSNTNKIRPTSLETSSSSLTDFLVNRTNFSSFLYEVSKSTITGDPTFTKGKTVNTFSVKIDVSKCSKYEKELSYMAGYDARIESLVVTFTIDAETGYFKTIVTQETYSVNIPVVGWQTCTSVRTEEFKKINVAVTIDVPASLNVN